MARTASLEDFRVKTQQDALTSLSEDIERLKNVTDLPENQASAVNKDMQGFTKIFAKFLSPDTPDSIRWDEIERLSAGAVSTVQLLLLRDDLLYCLFLLRSVPTRS